MDLELTGKVALVTGGSRGIGLAVAHALAAEGCDVALLAREEGRLERAAGAVASASGRRTLALPADTTDPAAVTTAMARAAAELGPVDVLVTAAATPNSSAGFGEDDLLGQVDVKLGGALRCARAVAPGMVERGFGRIVCISGLAARQTGSVVGSVRNVAVAAMAKNLADELAGTGVNVTCVHPGLTRTERTPSTLAAVAERRGVTPAEVERGFAARVAAGRMITAEEVASVVTFLCSPRSVAINGDAVVAAGGVLGSIYY